MDFAVYGRCGPLDMLKIVSRGVGTFSTPGQPHSENFFSPDFFDPQSSIFSGGAIRKGSYPIGEHGTNKCMSVKDNTAKLSQAGVILNIVISLNDL